MGKIYSSFEIRSMIDRAMTPQEAKQKLLEMMVKFDEFCHENNRTYYLSCGTLLGAIREHGFIKHDHDIDVWMWIEDETAYLIPSLRKYGFSLVYYGSVDEDRLGKFYKIASKGCEIDIFFVYPPIDQYPYCCDFVKIEGENVPINKKMARRIEMPISRDLKLTDFEGLQLPIPSNAEELCVFRYGENYLIPDPNWDWVREKKHLVEWVEMIDKTKYEKI